MLRAETPLVTIIVCTRDRGESISATVRSLFANSYPHFTLIIIDQSSDTRTEQALAAFRNDPRLRYLHVNTQGVSRALNSGLAFSTTELVLLTDDDCEVPPDWIAEMVAPFLRHPQVGIVFCDVVAGPHDSQAGFIPVSRCDRTVLIENLSHWQTCDGVNIGIGAGMALRRSMAEALTGFNPDFGPGARFRSGNDIEFTLNALAAGYQIYRTTAVSVVHHGFRSYAQGRQLVYRNLFGIGGTYGQLLQQGHLIGLRHYASVFANVVIRPALKDMANGQPPRKLGRAFWLLRGLVAGLAYRPPARTPGFRGLN